MKPAHVQLTFSGVFGSAAVPIEIWSFGLALYAPELVYASPAAMTPIASAARGAFFDYLSTILPSDVSLTRTRAASVLDTGHVDLTGDGQYIQGDDNTLVLGGVAAPARSPSVQDAIVVSLQTPRAGPSGKGRFFLPMTADAVAPTDRRISAAARDDILGRSISFVRALNTIANAGPVSVVSSKGFASGVTKIRVGRVVDTHRSRRNRLNEDYGVATV